MAALKPSQHVTSLSQFIELIEQVRSWTSGLQWIFRGQINVRAAWPLLPKVGRPDFLGKILENKFSWSDGQTTSSNTEGRVVRQVLPDFFAPPDILRFEEWCKRAIAVQPLPANHWERLALAQHYGLATRLLDWTQNPLVGLFFAVTSGEEDGLYGGVYALLAPHEVTSDVAFADCGRGFASDIEKALASVSTPAAFHKIVTYVPPPFDRRMLQQAAVFTYHVRPAVPLDPTAVGEPAEQTGDSWMATGDPAACKVGTNLIEFVVAPEYKLGLRTALAQLGMRYDTLFPDLEGLSREFNGGFRSRLTIRTQGIPIDEFKGSVPGADQKGAP